MRPERRYQGRRALRRSPSTQGRLSGHPLKRGPRPAPGRVWVLTTLLTFGGTWFALSPAQRESTTGREERGALDLGAATEAPKRPHKALEGDERGDTRALNVEDEPSSTMAISWRVEGAELGEEGLTPCAPVGWSGERVSVAQPAGPHELSGITWRPSGAEADEGIISQAIMHREGRLSLITNIDSARLMRAGVVARVMIRHQRLATCVIGPRSELHDPWLSKSWGASRWRDATPLASLERWVQLSSSPEGIHSTLGLARLGLPEQALKSSAPNGRALLRALVTSWLLHGSAARLGLGTWTLTPASKLPHWLGEPQVMVWRHAEGALEIKTRALLSATERLMRDVTQVARDLDATQGKRASRPREGSLTPKAAKGARRRPRLRPSPKPRRPPKPPKEDRLKRLKLKYD